MSNNAKKPELFSNQPSGETPKSDAVQALESTTADPFDPVNLRLPQNFHESVGVKKRLTTVPVRNPSKQDFIRVHPVPAYRLETMVLEFKDENETYLVAPELWPELPGELIPKVLFLATNRQKAVFLWPIRLPDQEGKLDDWNRSALEAATAAQTHWVRIMASRSLGAYELYEATSNLPEPEWPELSFREILKIAFKERYIKDFDHPALKRLRGEV
jgi:hypothetical protein